MADKEKFNNQVKNKPEKMQAIRDIMPICISMEKPLKPMKKLYKEIIELQNNE